MSFSGNKKEIPADKKMISCPDVMQNKAAQLKAMFDAAPIFANDNTNSLRDELEDFTGVNGASKFIGSPLINDVSGTTVYDQLIDLKRQIDGIVAGVVPEGSITAAMLSPELQATLSALQNQIDAKQDKIKTTTGAFTAGAGADQLDEGEIGLELAEE